ncbi:MAG: hypothetical protein M3314_00010 [Actinomycetota bacterium]|nr:hypothetical protein [Actinomycetota bacterium]
MAAPDYVPPTQADAPRQSLPIPPGRRWMATRPADLQHGQPIGPRFGRPGPDQGYAHSLAERFSGRLRLAEGEHEEDVVAGVVAVALRRASMFGRAPVIHDLELAFGLFGYLDDAPTELVAWRRTLLAGAAHQYWEQREVVDTVPSETLRLTPAQVRSRLHEWKTLTGADQGPPPGSVTLPAGAD